MHYINDSQKPVTTTGINLNLISASIHVHTYMNTQPLFHKATFQALNKAIFKQI